MPDPTASEQATAFYEGERARLMEIAEDGHPPERAAAERALQELERAHSRSIAHLERKSDA